MTRFHGHNRLLPLAVLCALLAGGVTLSAHEPPTPAELALIKKAQQHRIRTIERIYGAVVAVYGNSRRGGGSAVLFDNTGLALTNHHVVAAAGSEGWAGLADGRLYRWKLIGTDPGGDVAIIRLSGRKSFPAAPLGDSDKVRVGDFAMAMGNPFTLAENQTPTVTLGIVSGIKRFQAGTGKTGNMLVYGNCIQVDSSINPGNSGGPLFNMAGEVIGINGRGSFKERGRVNVGLGYAISVKQIKHFIPELLATKVAQHGTLDAQFSNRTGGVICDAINLDSATARAGLKLGDRLVSFEGETIADANHLTNLISTFPAGWPVEVTVERKGIRHTVRTRLIALPYDAPPKPKPQPAKRPGKKSAGKIPLKAQRPGRKPAAKPLPVPVRGRRGPRIDISKPGQIRDEKLNAAMCQLVLARWREYLGGGSFDGVIEIVDDVVRGGEKVGRQKQVIDSSGNMRLTLSLDGKETTVLSVRDGYWMTGPDGTNQRGSRSEALAGYAALMAAVLASSFEDRPLIRLGSTLIAGSDKAGGQRACRIQITGDKGLQAYAWYSVEDDSGRPQVRLLKTGHTLDSSNPRPAVVYEDWRDVQGIKIPFRRRVVAGMAETEQLQFITQSCRLQKGTRIK